MCYFLIVICCVFAQNIFAVVGSGGNVFGQTYFRDSGEFLAGAPVRIDLMPYLPVKDSKKKKQIGLTAVGLYANSNNNEKLAQYFMPNGDLLITTTGGSDYFVPGPLPSNQEAPNFKVVRDIDAAVLGITDPDFFSIFSMAPESRIAYVGFFGYYVLLFNDNNTPKLSLQCAVPLIYTQHKTIGKETIYKTGESAYFESPIKSVLAGLSRSELHFQRWNFSDCGMSNTTVPSLEFDLSYNFLPLQGCSIETYGGCLIPLSLDDNKKNIQNEFVFSPIVENSQHFGLQWGTTISLFLYENNERLIKFILGNNLLYFLPSDRVRSFDLQGRSWSRYLNVYSNFQTKDQEIVPLVNSLSCECRVSPNFSTIITTELHYLRKWLDAAVGYSLFARQSESVTILEDLPNIVLQGSNSDIISPLSIVRSISLRMPNEDVQGLEIDQNTNNQVFNANYFYAKIDNTMIDIASATHPAVFSGELYGKINIHWHDVCMILCGLSYRFSHNNTAIEYATAWLGLEYLF